MSAPAFTGRCRSCGRDTDTVHLYARGLCRRCHTGLGKAGALDQYPPIPSVPGGARRLTDLVEDCAFLAREGVPGRVMAERLGLSWGGVSAALRRARRAGLVVPAVRP